MPYIKPNDRSIFDGEVEDLSLDIETVGDLNYVVTRLSLRLLKKMGRNYNNISNILGTLSLIHVEIARRLIGPYEDTKIEENGDVFEYQSSFWTEK